MRCIAVSGSPREDWNTVMLLEKTLEGAASRGAETTLIQSMCRCRSHASDWTVVLKVISMAIARP